MEMRRKIRHTYRYTACVSSLSIYDQCGSGYLWSEVRRQRSKIESKFIVGILGLLFMTI